jgi:transcription initiation factor TFIIIB Brf1 subunit/transcription initiation factor TFIIB
MQWPTVSSVQDDAICTNCGLVVSEGNLVDDEWGVQKDDGTDMRRAEPLNGSNGWDMSTRIDGPDYNNLVKAQKYMSGNSHANREKCLSDLVLGRLGLNKKVLEGAKDVWARVDRTHAKKGGRTDEGLALACVHLALKEQGMNSSRVDLFRYAASGEGEVRRSALAPRTPLSHHHASALGCSGIVSPQSRLPGPSFSSSSSRVCS